MRATGDPGRGGICLGGRGILGSIPAESCRERAYVCFGLIEGISDWGNGHRPSLMILNP